MPTPLTPIRWYCITIFCVLYNAIIGIRMHMFTSLMYFWNHSISIGVGSYKEHYPGVCSMPWFQKVVLKMIMMQFHIYLFSTYFMGFHENFCPFHSQSLNNVLHMQWKIFRTPSSCKTICANNQMISCYTLHVCNN